MCFGSLVGMRMHRQELTELPTFIPTYHPLNSQQQQKSTNLATHIQSKIICILKFQDALFTSNYYYRALLILNLF